MPPVHCVLLCEERVYYDKIQIKSSERVELNLLGGQLCSTGSVIPILVLLTVHW